MFFPAGYRIALGVDGQRLGIECRLQRGVFCSQRLIVCHCPRIVPVGCSEHTEKQQPNDTCKHNPKLHSAEHIVNSPEKGTAGQGLQQVLPEG